MQVNQQFISAIQSKYIASGLEATPGFSKLDPVKKTEGAWKNCWDIAWTEQSYVESQVDLNNQDTWELFLRSEYCREVISGVTPEWAYSIVPFTAD